MSEPAFRPIQESGNRQDFKPLHGKEGSTRPIFRPKLVGEVPGKQRGFIDPNGETHKVAWWRLPTPHAIEWHGDPGGLLRQTDWGDGSNNNSGRLTQMLNGWMLDTALTPEEAKYIHDALVYAYRNDARYWQDISDDSGRKEFVRKRSFAAFVVTEATGKQMPLDTEVVSTGTAHTRLPELLKEGYILGLGKDDDWPTVFQPRNLDSEHAVSIDPRNSEGSGPKISVININDVPFLHDEVHAVVKM